MITCSRPRQPLFVALAVCIACFIYLSIFRDSLEEHYQSLVHNIPLTVQYHAEKDFVPSASEDACFYGRSAFFDTPEKDSIPNVLHFITALQADGSDADLPFFAYLSIRAALQTQDPRIVKIHHAFANSDAPYMQRLLRTDGHRIELVHHDPQHLQELMPNSLWVQHLADVLRLQLMMDEGGIYMDTDVFALKSFSDIRRSPRDVVMGHEGGSRFGLGNAVILARPGSHFIRRWKESYSDFTRGEWNDHSVILPKKLATEHENEICILSPKAFFWPTWTWHHQRYMHSLVPPGEEMDQLREDVKLYDGALYSGQLAYHAAHSMGNGRNLRELTEQYVRTNDTRFTVLLRPFLE